MSEAIMHLEGTLVEHLKVATLQVRNLTETETAMIRTIGGIGLQAQEMTVIVGKIALKAASMVVEENVPPKETHMGTQHLCMMKTYNYYI